MNLTPQKGSLWDAFNEFHRNNPHVYPELVRLARQWKAAGFQRMGVGMLFEVLRWNHGIKTFGNDFKLNNNFRSRYSRLIMSQEPDLADFFTNRELQRA